jgi:hypothetical protein
MRKLVLIRYGIASVLVGGGVGGMFAAGCGGDDNGGGPSNMDSGADATNTQPGEDAPTGEDGSMPPPGEAGTGTVPDGGAEAEAGPAPVHGKLLLVNASAYAPSLRFCYGFVHTAADGGPGPITIAKSAPAPNDVLGVPPGTGGSAPDTTANDLAAQTINLYAINAAKLATTATLPDAGAAELTCDALIGADALAADAGGLGLTQGIDYWSLGVLPAGTIANGSTTLAAVIGCAPGNADPTSIAVNCPSGYSATTGSLALWYKTLDTTTAIDGGSIGAQFAFLSYPFKYEAAATLNSQAAIAGFYETSLVEVPVPDAGADGGDGGSDAATDAAPQFIPVESLVPVAAPVLYSTFPNFLPPTLVSAAGVKYDGTSGFVVTALGADGGTTSFSVPIPLPTIHDLSWGPGSDAGVFQNGDGYVFILVGDPNPAVPTFVGLDGGPSAADAGGTFNYFSAHILGFPTNPPFGSP